MKSAIPVAVGLAAMALLSARPADARIIGRTAETSIGREAASAIEQYLVVDADPASVARVRQIGRRLAAAAKDPDFPFEFHVVESPDVNAFALPGGFIYVFRGALQLMPNDDALASVLAHEISHVTRHHSIKQFEKSLILNAGISAILAGTGTRGWGSAADVAQAIAALSFTRSDEADADDEGLRLLTRAGYDPRAAAEAMRVVRRASGDGKKIPALLRSHPAPDSRIKRLTELGDQLLAQREKERAATPPAPALAPPPPRRISGLEGVEIRPVEWWPLAPGARWSYRSRSGDQGTTVTVRALETVQAEPAGVYRVEYQVGRSIRTVRLVAPAGDRVFSRPESAAEPFRAEALFNEGAQAPGARGTLRTAGMERVQVPAGEFETRRVDVLDDSGAVQSTLWFAKGVGLVKSTSAVTGTVVELTEYQLPAMVR